MSVYKSRMTNFISHNRSQALVLPRDLREWAPEDDPCHFIIEAVERIPIGAFKVNWKDTGKARHPPLMMLALLIYCSTNGMFSSRRIGKAAFRDVAERFVAADIHPDHDTVATFRCEHQAAFAATIAAPCDQVGRPTTVLGDPGFANGEAIKSIEARKIEMLVAVSRPDNRRTCDFQPLKPDARPPPEPEAGWRKRMRETMRIKAAREKYKRRKCIVEPVFGLLGNVLGFNRFHPGGIENVKAEGLLAALADNCKRLCNLNAAKAARGHAAVVKNDLSIAQRIATETGTVPKAQLVDYARRSHNDLEATGRLVELSDIRPKGFRAAESMFSAHGYGGTRTLETQIMALTGLRNALHQNGDLLERGPRVIPRPIVAAMPPSRICLHAIRRDKW